MFDDDSVRLDVERTRPPDEGAVEWNVHTLSMTAHDGPWGTLLPDLSRILLEPGARHRYPGPPARDTAHAHAIAYWHAALELLVYRLGWIDAAKGLDAWLQAGSPVNDPATLVLRDIYSADGQLPLLHEWLRTGAAETWAETVCRAANAAPPMLPTPVRPSAEAVAMAERLDVHNPLTGGSDPLHLTTHLVDPAADDEDHPDAEMFRSDLETRRAALLLSTARGWYSQLGAWGQALPDIGDRSWHVEVIIRPSGSLGTFRRSRQTGLWFQGRHRSHQLGW